MRWWLRCRWGLAIVLLIHDVSIKFLVSRRSLWSINVAAVGSAFSVSAATIAPPKIIIRGLKPQMWEWDFIHQLFPSTYFDYNMTLSTDVGAGAAADIIVCADDADVAKIRKGVPDNHGSETDIRRDHVPVTIPVLLHLSDETLQQFGCTQLYRHSGLVLRAYGDKQHRAHNVHQLALGYMNTYLPVSSDNFSTTSTPPSAHIDTDRPYRWSFIGNLHGKGKEDRAWMIQNFSSWKPYFLGQNMTPAEIRSYYSNSTFVVSGRGWHRLDCLRIYEAMIAGAVPVIAGDTEEIVGSFNFNGDPLPAVYASSWDLAVEIVQGMTKQQIDEKRKQLLIWWTRHLKTIRHLVASTIGTELSRVSSWLTSLSSDSVDAVVYTGPTCPEGDSSSASLGTFEVSGVQHDSFIVRGVNPQMRHWDYLKELLNPPFFQFLPSLNGSADVYICSSNTDALLLRQLFNDHLSSSPQGHHLPIKVLIHLPDSFQEDSHCNHLYHLAKLVLHGYGGSRSVGGAAKRENVEVHQLPLGYMNQYLSLFDRNNSEFALQPKRILKAYQRRYRWSFVGSLNNDRLAILKRLTQPKVAQYVGSFVSTGQVKGIYDESVFVLCFAGWGHLDTMRVYEAIIAGCIPVIVGKVDDLVAAFSYGADRLPAVFAPDWNQAQRVIKLFTNEQVDETREKLRDWWIKRLKKTRQLISRTLSNDQRAPEDPRGLLWLEYNAGTTRFSVDSAGNNLIPVSSNATTQKDAGSQTIVDIDNSSIPWPQFSTSYRTYPAFSVRGLKENMWEWDYLRELFDLPYFATSSSYNGTADIVICSSFEDYTAINAFRRSVNDHQPIPILVHMSDEQFATKGCVWLYQYSKLILRGYWGDNLFGSNVLQLPLGYMRGYLPTVAQNRSSSDWNASFSTPGYAAETPQFRPYRWSFLGSKHGRGTKERTEMLDTFSAWKPHIYTNGLSPAQVYTVYSQSDFVLSARGWVNLDCLRVYEAILAGAVPVVVGDPRELHAVFDYNGHRLPALYAHSWAVALDRARSLTAVDIAEKRRQLQKWWVSTLHRIRSAVAASLGDIRADIWLAGHTALSNRSTGHL
jgi:hypothetical protein